MLIFLEALSDRICMACVVEFWYIAKKAVCFVSFRFVGNRVFWLVIFIFHFGNLIFCLFSFTNRAVTEQVSSRKKFR